MLASVKKYVEMFLEEHPMAGVRSDRVVYFDVTNRLIDGSCYLFFAGDEQSPALVAKAARTSRGKAVFEIEYENLSKLQAIGMNAEGPATPEPLGRWYDGETLITLQSALPGELMKNVPGSRLFAPDSLDASLDMVLGWWIRFQTHFGTRRVRLAEQTYESEILASIELFRRRYLLERDEQDFLDQRFDRERTLLGVDLPFMARHGDFCAANMVLQDRRIGVFDWEFPLALHMPLFDLFFFFSSVRFPFKGRRGEASHSESFAAVYWGDSYFSAAMRSRLLEVCRAFDIPQETLADLLVLSLIQTANMKYDGLVESHGMREDPDARPTESEKSSRWASFQRPDKDAPFAWIRGGVYENLRQVVRRGLPGFE